MTHTDPDPSDNRRFKPAAWTGDRWTLHSASRGHFAVCRRRRRRSHGTFVKRRRHEYTRSRSGARGLKSRTPSSDIAATTAVRVTHSPGGRCTRTSSRLDA